MIFKCYSILDETTKTYHYPINFIQEEYAIRWFKQKMNYEPGFRIAPEDFNLYYMGTYDDASGTFIQDLPFPERIEKGVNVIVNN